MEDREEEAEPDEHDLIVDTRIFEVLTLGRGIVTQSDSGTVHMTYFSRDAPFWCLFIAQNLHPVSQEHEVRWESYRLLYRIITGQYTNVGSIIRKRFADWRPVVRQRLGFPHLIMALCVAAGIEVPTDSLLVRPLSPFAGTYIYHRIKIQRGMSEMTSREYYALHQRGFDPHPGESDGEQGSLPDSPPESPPPPQTESQPEQQRPPHRAHHVRGESSTTGGTGDLAELTQMMQSLVSTQERLVSTQERLVSAQERMEQTMASEHARQLRAQARLARRQERLARHQSELGHWMHTSMAQLGYEIPPPPAISPPSPDEEED